MRPGAPSCTNPSLGKPPALVLDWTLQRRLCCLTETIEELKYLAQISMPARAKHRLSAMNPSSNGSGIASSSCLFHCPHRHLLGSLLLPSTRQDAAGTCSLLPPGNL